MNIFKPIASPWEKEMISLRAEIAEPAPHPTQRWLSMDEKQRLLWIDEYIPTAYREKITVCKCEDNGFVYVEFRVPLRSSERGVFLMDFEQHLKSKVDEALVVFHLPQGDKSSLRRLRGVGVK